MESFERKEKSPRERSNENPQETSPAVNHTDSNANDRSHFYRDQPRPLRSKYPRVFRLSGAKPPAFIDHSSCSCYAYRAWCKSSGTLTRSCIHARLRKTRKAPKCDRARLELRTGAFCLDRVAWRSAWPPGFTVMHERYREFCVCMCVCIGISSTHTPATYTHHSRTHTHTHRHRRIMQRTIARI